MGRILSTRFYNGKKSPTRAAFLEGRWITEEMEIEDFCAFWACWENGIFRCKWSICTKSSTGGFKLYYFYFQWFM